MKLNVNVEATPLELREFLGLPDLQPLHDEMISIIRDNMTKGVQGFDPATLMKPLLPGPIQVQSMEALQKAFWEAFQKNAANMTRGAGARKEGTNKEGTT